MLSHPQPSWICVSIYIIHYPSVRHHTSIFLVTVASKSALRLVISYHPAGPHHHARNSFLFRQTTIILRILRILIYEGVGAHYQPLTHSIVKRWVYAWV